MKWLWMVPLALIGAAAAVMALGLMLPMSHLAHRRARYRASPETIFALLSDFAGAASWRAGVQRIELLPPRDGKICFREHSGQGALTFVVDELSPGKIVTRIEDNEAFGGTWTWQIIADAQGTLLALTEKAEIYNPFFRVMSALFFSPTKTMDAVLVSLGKKLGEAVQPESF